jgi:hypothetical protein
VAIPIGQRNRPELVRQTLIPAFPPRGLGSDDAHTGRRRRREGGATLNLSGASSTLSQRARPDWRANARGSSSSRANSHTNECRAQPAEVLGAQAERLPRRRTCESASARTSARGRVEDR